MSIESCVAFVDAKKIAGGSVADVLCVLKPRFDADPGEVVWVFEMETGRQIDFDLTGSLEEVLARAAPVSKGPGRPKLGVTGREISLLPRHWDWLEAQPKGISATVRRLVEEAMRKDPEGERARRLRDAATRVLGVLAGNRPHFEEAMRALYSGETERFESLVKRWPKDVRDLAIEHAREAARADALSTTANA